jgi:hypothetical protein
VFLMFRLRGSRWTELSNSKSSVFRWAGHLEKMMGNSLMDSICTSGTLSTKKAGVPRELSWINSVSFSVWNRVLR